MRISKAVFSCSLIAAAIAVGHADYRSLDRQVQASGDLAAAAKAVQADPEARLDPRLASLVRDASQLRGSNAQRRFEILRDAVALRARVQGGASGEETATRIGKIKSSAFYSDPKRKESNWLKDAYENLKKLLSREPRTPDVPSIAPPSIFGSWLVVLMYTLLGLGLLAFAFFAVRYFQLSAKQKRQASALMEEDEPERSLDEWLEMAAKLEAEGRYREAVRCLYLACLLRFDEAEVARFVRGQTNWEHLRRIEASPKLPQGLQFREATRSFDHIWYGHKVKGQSDVDEFRQRYTAVTGALRGRAA